MPHPFQLCTKPSPQLPHSSPDPATFSCNFCYLQPKITFKVEKKKWRVWEKAFREIGYPYGRNAKDANLRQTPGKAHKLTLLCRREGEHGGELLSWPQLCNQHSSLLGLRVSPKAILELHRRRTGKQTKGWLSPNPLLFLDRSLPARASALLHFLVMLPLGSHWRNLSLYESHLPREQIR